MADNKLVSDEMLEAAKKAETKRATESERIVPRTKERVLIKSDIPYPEGMDPQDFDHTAFAAVITKQATLDEPAKFYLDGDKARYLHFQPKGRSLPGKRLYNVKAIKPNGHIVQIPFEPQFHNNAAGGEHDALGLRKAEREGFRVLIDWATMRPVYCAAWDCWAQADDSGFCCEAHGKHTAPNRYRETRGLMSSGATTSHVWGS